jgi:hypothetical protein
MDPVAVIAALVAGVTAFSIKAVLDRTTRDKTKELIAKLPDGREEQLTVPVDATNDSVSSTFREIMEFESHIAKALDAYRRNVPDFTYSPGRIVDFVAERGSRRLGIEVKNRADHLTLSQIERYLAAEGGLKDLIVMSLGLPPQSIKEKLATLGKEHNVAFIDLRQGSDAFITLRKTLDQSLGSFVAPTAPEVKRPRPAH